MADLQEREQKLVQYLTEAHGKEQELESALQEQIGVAVAKSPLKKRLQDHLKETKSHKREVERRIKKLGGSVGGVTATATTAASKVVAVAKTPAHLVRGTGEAEKILKNARTAYSEEHNEIAQYTAIVTLAEAVGDKDTAQLAKSILREEVRMAGFLEKQIPRLTKAVVKDEIPAKQRGSATKRRASPGRTKPAARTTAKPAARKRAKPAARKKA